MFDIRKPIKIFVAKGEVRYGSRVANGFFPVFSVQTEEDAKALVEALPWVCTDSLTTYARRLESMCHQVLTKRPQSDDAMECLRTVTSDGVSDMHNAITSAIMGDEEMKDEEGNTDEILAGAVTKALGQSDPKLTRELLKS